MASSFKDITIVCLDNLGDVVFTTPLHAEVRRLWPSAKTRVLTKSYGSQVAAFFEGIDECLAVDPPWASHPGAGNLTWCQKLQQWIYFCRTIWRLRQKHQQTKSQLVLICSRNWRVSAAMSFVFPRAFRVGFSDRKNKLFVHASVDYPSQGSASQRLLSLITCVDRGYSYSSKTIPCRLVKPASSPLHPKANGRVVAMHAFSGGWRRVWPLSNWLIVAQWLRERGYTIRWIAHGAERDAIPAEFKSEILMDRSLDEMLHFISRVDLFLGHDSGPTHCAQAFGVRIFALYLPGEPDRTFPQGVGEARILIRNSPQELKAAEVCVALEQYDG